MLGSQDWDVTNIRLNLYPEVALLRKLSSRLSHLGIRLSILLGI